MAYLHNTIDSQLPQHVIRDYPLFVEFLRAYYEWLGQNGQPYYGIEQHLDWMNFKDSIDDYISFLRKEYLFNLPANTAGGLEIFLKNSKQFHLSVGTEESFKFIFKILFGADAGDVNLYFPRKDILRVSDSTWTAAQNLMYITDSGKSGDFLYRVIKQTREIYPGVFRYAYAIVERISNRYAGKFQITELYLRDIQGEFMEGWPVTVENTNEWIIPTGNLTKVIDSGIQYYLDDKVSIGGDEFFIKSIVALEDGIIDTQISGLFTNSELGVKVDGVSVVDFNYDGRYLAQKDIFIDSVVEITFPTFEGYIVIDDIGPNGEIKSLKVIDSPIGITVTHPINISTSAGTGFSGTVEKSLLRPISGYFIDDRGHLNSTKVIQDSDYYQDFSYVIRSSLDVDKYRDIVLKLLHPAGMKMFGKVDIIEIIKLFILGISDEITIPEKSILIDISEAQLYSIFDNINKFRYTTESSNYRTFHFKDVRTGDVCIDRVHKHFNFNDVIITSYPTNP